MYINYVEVFNSVQTEDTAIEVNDLIDYGFIEAVSPLEGADSEIVENDVQTVESLENDIEK